jgi:RNA polymerase sigma-70 factor (ECF subfamily)
LQFLFLKGTDSMVLSFIREKNRFEDIQPDLYAYAISLTRNHDLADDLVQDTLLKLHGGSQTPAAAQNVKRYSFRMLRNLHIDNLRKNKVRLEYSAEQERLWSDTNSDRFDTVEQLIVRDAFSQLSPDHREILFLVDVMGFQYAEAAETLDVAPGTIMSRVSRARAEMIDILERSSVTSLKEQRRKRNK